MSVGSVGIFKHFFITHLPANIVTEDVLKCKILKWKLSICKFTTHI